MLPLVRTHLLPLMPVAHDVDTELSKLSVKWKETAPGVAGGDEVPRLTSASSSSHHRAVRVRIVAVQVL